MRNLVIVFFIALILSACEQLLKGQQQPVIPRTNGNYFTSCSGTVENWASCNDKALKTCQNGYEEVKKEENGSGIVRELTFKCKK